MPNGIIPYGIWGEIDCDAKTITLLESTTTVENENTLEKSVIL